MTTQTLEVASRVASRTADDPLVRAYAGRIAAGALVMHPNGLVLAFQRKSESVGIPCGKLEHGETPAEAALREVKEETGYDIEIDTKVTPYVGFDANDTLVFTYKAKICGGDIHVRPISEGTPCWSSFQALIEGKYGAYNSRMLHHFEVSYPAWWKHREMEGWIAEAFLCDPDVDGTLVVTLASPGSSRLALRAHMDAQNWVTLSNIWRMHGCVVRADPVAKFR